MANSPPTTDPSSWRFSVRTFMAAIAAFLGLVWFFSWRWDADERIVLAVWLICVLPVIALGRRGRFRGLVAAAVLGAIVPVTVFWLSHVLRLGFGLGTRVEALMTLTLVTIAIGGGLAAMLATGLIRLFGDLGPKLKERVAGITLVLIAVGLVGRIILIVASDRARWKPVFKMPALDSGAATTYFSPYVLSDDGTLLAIAQPFQDSGNQPKSRLQIWNIESQTESPRVEFSIPMVHALSFAPDGSKVAVVHTSGICIYETSTGKLEKTLNASAFSPWQGNTCCFSADGRKLAFCNYDHKAQRFTVQVWQTDPWEPVSKRQIEGIVRLFATEQGILLQTDDGPRLLDAETLVPLKTKNLQYDRRGYPFVTRDGRYIGSGHSLIEIETGQLHRLQAPINGLLWGGRFVTRRCDMDAYQYVANPDFRSGVPFVRHWWRRGYTSGQAVLVDVATGKEICSSPNYVTEGLTDIKSSADGKTVASQTWTGSMYVWKVPK